MSWAGQRALNPDGSAVDDLDGGDVVPMAGIPTRHPPGLRRRCVDRDARPYMERLGPAIGWPYPLRFVRAKVGQVGFTLLDDPEEDARLSGHGRPSGYHADRHPSLTGQRRACDG